jgi:hypothetical protein
MARSVYRSLILGLGATAVLACVAAAPARADDDRWRHERHEDWRDREERREEWREREWREWCYRHPGAYAYPGYYCPMPAPPPVVYAPPPPPPPVIYAPQPSLEIVVPFHVR